MITEEHQPLSPFTRETALQKVKDAEGAWTSCDPERVALAYGEVSWSSTTATP